MAPSQRRATLSIPAPDPARELSEDDRNLVESTSNAVPVPAPEQYGLLLL